MKFFITSFLLFFTLFINTFAQQEAHIFVPTLKTDKTMYSQGESIQAEFQIDNNSDLRQSDVYVTSSLVVKVNNENVELNSQKHQEGLYLEALSKRKITIEHLINADINGPAEFVVSVFQKDGSLVGQKRNPITVINQNAKDIVVFDQAYISVDNEKFPLQAGPTVSENESVKIEFTTATLSTDVSVQAKIELYDRTQSENNVLHTITPPQIVLQSNGFYTIELPTDLNAKVYEGVLSFSSSDTTIAPVYFRYIIEGPIGTILNVNSNKLSAKKDEVIQILVEYAGTPVAISNLENNIFDAAQNQNDVEIEVSDTIDVENLSDEDLQKLIEKTINEQSNENQNQQKAIIKVSLIDEDGNIVGTGSSSVNLNESGTESIDVSIQKNIERFSVVSEMTLEDGTLLSLYKTDLPSEKELKEIYEESTGSSWIFILFSVILIPLLLIVIISIRKKLNQYALILTIPILFAIGTLGFLYTSEAFTTNFASYANGANHFKVNAIFSPGPGDSVSYAPGEAFNLSLNASYIACRNSGFTNILYGPSDDWSNFNLEGLYPAFDFQRVYYVNSGKTSRTMYVQHLNIAEYIGDGWGSGTVLPRFGAWWTTSGSLATVPFSPAGKFFPWRYENGIFISNPTPASGFYTPSTGKGGQWLWQTSAWGSSGYGVGKHETSSNYNINPSHTYYMPTEPGFHTFSFMLLNYAAGNTASVRIVSQEVCVRGAGVCPDEEIELSACPNLIGVFTQNELGQIFQDGAITNYVKDGLGNCITPPVVCSDAYTEGQLICINGEQYTMSCSVDGTWLQIPTGNSCLSDTYCVAQPVEVVPNQDVTFTAYPSGATYQWKENNGSEISGETSRVFTTSFSNIGSYQYKVDITDETTVTESCSVSVTCANRPADHGQCINNIQKMYSCQSDGSWNATSQSCGTTDDSGSQTSVDKFLFNPNIANSSRQCMLELEARGVSSCTLSNRTLNELVFSAGADSTISILGQSVGVGSWTLSCTDIEGVTNSYGTQRCVSNPNVSEQ